MATVRLKSSDDQIFEVDVAVALKSHAIKNMITMRDDMGFGSDTTLGTSITVPLPNVSGKILAKVIQYCKYHVDAINSNFEDWANWLRDQQVRDQEYFDVDRNALFYLIPEIKNQIEAAKTMPLHNASKKIQEKVHEYCDYNIHDAMSNYEDWKTWADDVKVWDQQFVEVDNETFIDLVRAANYLDIENLLVLTRKKFADMMKGKTSEEIRRMFRVNLTPEEEEEARHENQFAFEH